MGAVDDGGCPCCAVLGVRVLRSPVSVQPGGCAALALAATG